MSEEEPKLRRIITLPQLVFYGVGTMVGGGFYALTGKVAAEAGMMAPVAFLVSGLLAAVNAFTFAELSSRMPVSASAAHYAQAAFGCKWFSGMIGWLVIATGVVSAGTLAVATVRFLGDLVMVPNALGIVVVVLALGLVAAWGIGESVWTVTVITFIEVSALIYVLFAAGGNLSALPERLPEMLPGLSSLAWIGILSGAFLAFYSFLGFEDMVTMAEEVKDVRRTLPIGILLSIVITVSLYVMVMTVAVLTVAPAELAAANTPFARVIGGTEGLVGKAMVVVSMLTGINGALVQIIMAARMAYGLAGTNAAPRLLGVVHPKTRTPLNATAFMSAIVLLLALFFPLVTLAKATSTIILFVFALLNVALVRIKLRGDVPPENAVTYPIGLPIAGFFACTGILVFSLWRVLAAA